MYGATSLLLVCLALSYATESKSTNFVFMMADDLGYGDVAYNGGTAETPNLDDMARGPHSIRLNRYYSGGPVCSPTRGTLLTGRNHNRYCIWTANAGNTCNDFECPEGMPLPTSEETVAEILQKQGYLTAAFGKWHLGDFKPLGGNAKWPVSRPDMHGFGHWWMTERSAPTTDLNCACFNSSLCARGHYTDLPPCTDYYSRDDELGVLLGLTHPVPGDDSHFLVTLVEEFLKSAKQRDKPFFIYVPFHAVHIRYIASMSYISRYYQDNYTQDEIDYYGAITAMDAAVGLIRELLRKYDVADNTMVWFVSDNGPKKGTPGRTGGFRGWKAQLYEGGIRVPGIIEWPAMINTNRASDYAVIASDLLPTVCDILNVDPPTDRVIDGVSIMPLIREEKPTRNQTIAWAYNINGNFFGRYNAVMSGDRYKLYAVFDGGKISSAELYDLIEDPFETINTSDKHPETLQQYKEQLQMWRDSVYQSAQDVGCLGVSKSKYCPC